MKVQNATIQKLLEKYKEISLLGRVGGVLGWDLEVNLPSKASHGRAEQSAYITKLVTEKWLDSEFRNLLEKANDPSVAKAMDGKEKAIVRNLNRGANFYYKVPKEIVIELSEETSKAFVAWAKARQENDFKAFLPHLKKLISLSQTIAEKVGYKDDPYDALLDLYEPELTSAKCKEVFSLLTPQLSDLVRKIKDSETYEKQSSILSPELEFSQADQEKVSHFVLRKIGYDLDAGRLDIAPHPFTIELGREDVRITTRYKKNEFVESIMVAMHEGGHALYEQGVSGDYTDTPLGGGVSLGIHESQSRFWENQIGRSREFIQYLNPVIRSFFHAQLKNVSDSELFMLFNKVTPGLIRVEADEVTYNLHIALRFELENELINGRLKPEDLPEIWNAKMKEYLGITPENNAHGVLQDVHWSHGSFGYFPTYTLGNLYAAQITESMRKEIEISKAWPFGLEKLSEKGEFGTILSWLRSNIHIHGSLYFPAELIKKVTGEALDAKYFLSYITHKYSHVYSL